MADTIRMILIVFTPAIHARFGITHLYGEASDPKLPVRTHMVVCSPKERYRDRMRVTVSEKTCFMCIEEEVLERLRERFEKEKVKRKIKRERDRERELSIQKTLA